MPNEAPVRIDGLFHSLLLYGAADPFLPSFLQQLRHVQETSKAGHGTVSHSWQFVIPLALQICNDVFVVGYSEQQKLVRNHVAQTTFKRKPNAPRHVGWADVMHPLRNKACVARFQLSISADHRAHGEQEAALPA